VYLCCDAPDVPVPGQAGGRGPPMGSPAPTTTRDGWDTNGGDPKVARRRSMCPRALRTQSLAGRPNCASLVGTGDGRTGGPTLQLLRPVPTYRAHALRPRRSAPLRPNLTRSPGSSTRASPSLRRARDRVNGEFVLGADVGARIRRCGRSTRLIGHGSSDRGPSARSPRSIPALGRSWLIEPTHIDCRRASKSEPFCVSVAVHWGRSPLTA
jgi:hypothetical protein